MSFSRTGWSQKEHIAVFGKEAAGGEIEDGFLGKAGIEGPVEGIEGFDLPEAGSLDAAAELAVGTHEQFVLQEQFEEFGMTEAVALGLVETDIKALGQAGQA
jgi:hypothetical protein